MHLGKRRARGGNLILSRSNSTQGKLRGRAGRNPGRRRRMVQALNHFRGRAASASRPVRAKPGRLLLH